MSRTPDLEAMAEEWLTTLTSPLSTPTERINVLNEIEKTLVAVTDPARSATADFLPPVNQTASVFWALQATAGYSLAEVLLAHVYRLHLDLERENELNQVSQEPTTSASISRDLSTSSSKLQGLGLGVASPSQTHGRASPHAMPEVQRQRVHSTVSEICIAITILQGLTLCSKATRRITQRKSALELLLQIVLADYCTQLLPPILSPSSLSPTNASFALPHSPATPTSISSSSSSSTYSSPSKPPSMETTTDAPLSLPSGFALDLLMCILVDSDVAQERFSDMGGIHQIVQLSHKCADTVTTPASTPVTATSPSFAQAVARSSHITALKQTDLLCLEFRYFWSQLLHQADPASRRSSLQGVTSAATSFYSVAEEPAESATPKASPKKRASRADLRAQRKAQEEKETIVETPKATTRKRVVAPTTVRATSEEAPTRPSSARTESAVASGSPRKLRQSTSVAELRKKPSTLSRSNVSPPPVPALPSTTRTTTESPKSYNSDPLGASRRQRLSTARPSTSDSRPQSRTERKEERVRRSTVSEAVPVPPVPTDQAGKQETELNKFNASRPGMSSRDRPRIPSPLKARTPAQEVAELEERIRRKQALASQQAIPYRRLRSSTTSTPFDVSSGGGARHGRSRDASSIADVDENRNPFSTAANVATTEAIGMKARIAGEENVTPSVSQRSSLSSAGSTRTSLGSLGSAARIPPSPAVRRAQLARARSLSPKKLSLPMTPTTPTAAYEY
ncbi:hypothetical protein PHBOTO_004252 [Pseudozyma hubeiensis]|nr:hypothetical protein PHBOTO_004252 [Pseudozyma hubeiensis]